MLPDQTPQAGKVAIIGAGGTGSAFACALLQNGLAAEIVLIDPDRARAEREVLDLNTLVPLTRSARVWAGTASDCQGAAVTVITVPSAEDRHAAGVDYLRSVLPPAGCLDPDGILLVAAEPINLTTYAAWKLSGLPARQVLGLGTLLETAHFRRRIAEYFNVSPRSVHAYIIGEQSSGALPVWSQANIDGMLLSEYSAQYRMQHSESDMQNLFMQARDASQAVIQRKGASGYAAAQALLKIVEAVLLDRSAVLTVSTALTEDYQIDDSCLSLPANLSRGGVEWVLRLDLTKDELDLLHASADQVRLAAHKANLR